MKNEYLTSSNRLFNNLLLNILVLIVAFVVSTIFSLLFIYFSNQDIDAYQRTLTSIIFDSVFIISLFLAYRIRNNNIFRQLWGKTNYKIILAVLLIVPFVYGLKELFIIITSGETTIIQNPNADIRLLIYASLMVFAGAIFEELVFRGYLLKTIFSYTNSAIVAVTLSSILFALVHIGKNYDDIYSIFSIFITGVILSLIVLRTGSLWIVTVIHILHNLKYYILFNEEYSIFQTLYAYDSTLVELIYENIQDIVICILVLWIFRFYKKKNIKTE